MVDENRIEGAARNFAGKVEDVVGQVTGDSKTQAEGKADQVSGQVQNAAGGVADAAREAASGIAGFVQDQPMTALLAFGSVALVIGFMLG